MVQGLGFNPRASREKSSATLCVCVFVGKLGVFKVYLDPKEPTFFKDLHKEIRKKGTLKV